MAPGVHYVEVRSFSDGVTGLYKLPIEFVADGASAGDFDLADSHETVNGIVHSNDRFHVANNGFIFRSAKVHAYVESGMPATTPDFDVADQTRVHAYRVRVYRAGDRVSGLVRWHAETGRGVERYGLPRLDRSLAERYARIVPWRAAPRSDVLGRQRTQPRAPVHRRFYARWRAGANVFFAGETDWIQKLHRSRPGDVAIARANLSFLPNGEPAYGRTRPGANLVPRGRSVDLWTSPSDRPAPCGPWGQPLDNAGALPAA